MEAAAGAKTSHNAKPTSKGQSAKKPVPVAPGASKSINNTQQTIAAAATTATTQPPSQTSTVIPSTETQVTQPPHLDTDEFEWQASQLDFDFTYSCSALPSAVLPQNNAQVAPAVQAGSNVDPPKLDKDLFANINIPPLVKTAPILHGPSQPPPPKKKAASSGNRKAEAPYCCCDCQDYETLTKHQKKVSPEEQLQPSSILEAYLQALRPTEEPTSAPGAAPPS
uniref:Uncharacterized protein n=1 Tax=Candolleomyces aberdarensis TaxID=2316362 RepID=A0A4Q2D0Q7_9AGAR